VYQSFMTALLSLIYTSLFFALYENFRLSLRVLDNMTIFCFLSFCTLAVVAGLIL
jgi:hypothetical protein